MTRKIRLVPERAIAIGLLLEYADWDLSSFSLMGFYDDDFDFLVGVAKRLGVENDKAFINKLTRVVRRLVQYNVLYSKMRGTNKEYYGEPTKQMDYWPRPGKIELIRKGKTENTMSPEDECSFLLRHAYPEEES